MKGFEAHKSEEHSTDTGLLVSCVLGALLLFVFVLVISFKMLKGKGYKASQYSAPEEPKSRAMSKVVAMDRNPEN